MYKDGGLETSQYYIRLAGEVFPMEAETIPAGMEIGSHNLFRRCIAGSDPRHDPAPFIHRESISHDLLARLSRLDLQEIHSDIECPASAQLLLDQANQNQYVLRLK